MRSISLPWALLLGNVLISSVFAVTCYTLDQEEAKDWIPCDTSADGITSHSACCSPNDVCMDTGLCLSTRNSDPAGLLWVDACTDRSFKNGACPSICIDYYNMPMNLTYMSLRPCGTNEWCCNIGSHPKVVLPQGIGTVIRQLPSVTGAISSQSTLSGTTSSTIYSASSISTDSTSPVPSTESNNYNTGYIAGIAITSAGFAISLVAFLVTFYRFRHLQQSSQVQQLNITNYGAGMEQDPSRNGQNKRYHEIETREPHVELPQ